MRGETCVRDAGILADKGGGGVPGRKKRTL